MGCSGVADVDEQEIADAVTEAVALSEQSDRRGMGACGARSLRRPSAAAIEGACSSCGEVVNGLMYILSTGCQWRAIAKDLPPRSTLYDYFTCALGRHARLHPRCALCAVPPSRRREASPTAAIIDSQSVKSAEKGGLRLIRRATMRAKRSRAGSATSSSIRRAC